jgi:hypothetical protein
MKTALTALLLSVLMAARLAAQDYLTDPALFTAAWAKLSDRLDGADLAEIRIGEASIEVHARAAAGGARIDAWKVQRRRGLLGKVDAVSGPGPVRPSGPVADVSGAFFAAGEVAFDQLPELLRQTLEQTPFQDPARVTGVRIGRRIAIIPTPAYADLRISISMANPREQASAEATPDGGLIGIDISQTQRGRTRDFLTQ